MNTNKTLVISGALLLLAGVFVVVNSFAAKQTLLQSLCVTNESSSQNIYFDRNVECSSTPIYGSVTYDFALISFIVGLVILIPSAFKKELNFKKGLAVFLFITLANLLFFFVDQILQNTFRTLVYSGFQDAGWEIHNQSGFMQELTNPTDLPQGRISNLIITCVALLIFPFTTGMGAFISGIIVNKLGKDASKIVGAMSFVVLTIVFQLLVIVLSFPVLLWLSFQSL